MRLNMARGRLALMSAWLLAAGITLAACGSSSSNNNNNTTTPPARSATEASNKVTAPASVKSQGYLSVEATPGYPPFSSLTNGKWSGVDVDLINAAAREMGVKARITAAQSFAAMIPAIANHRYDVLVGGFADTPLRRKAVGIFDIYKLRNHAIVKAGNPSKINVNNLCGQSTIVAQGTEEEGLAQQLAKQCQSSGKPALRIEDLASDGAVIYDGVANGRASFTLDNPVHGAYVVKQQPGLTILAGGVGPEVPSGWIIAKGNTQMQTALEQAISELIKNGTWQKILAKWHATGSSYVPPRFDGQPFSSES